MTPKEKAIELYDKMLSYFQGDIDKNTAKQCTLITIDEIRDVTPMISEIQDYWIQVKNEIEKL